VLNKVDAIYLKNPCKQAEPTSAIGQQLDTTNLRHEATSRFFELSLNVVEVAAITGHKDLKMLQRYTHLRAEALARKLQ